MVSVEWFRLIKSEDALPIPQTENFTRQKFPYTMNKASFDKLEDMAVFYKHAGRIEYEDFLFEPTFMIGDYFQTLFHNLSPEMQFKSVIFLDAQKQENAPTPIYWVPYLPCGDVIHPDSEIVLGKVKNLVLQKEKLGEARIIHAKLPADDIWLLSLEAAECILRRGPMGITLSKVELR